MSEPLKPNQIKITIKVEQPNGASTIHERVLTLGDADGVFKPVDVITRAISTAIDLVLARLSWLRKS